MNQIVVKQNGLAFELNKENFTAQVDRSFTAQGNITIPRSIYHESQEYKIIGIKVGSFENNMQINKIRLPEDSEIRVINEDAFASSSIYSINLPPSIEKLCEGWYKYTWRLKNIKISPQNTNFAYLDYTQKVIIGKSDTKSDNYDLLVFSSRQITNITIPSTIKVISSFAFSNCSNLKKIIFESNSNLNAIEKEAFSWSPIESITLPSKLKTIGDSAFYKCTNLKTDDFERDSELISIGINSFSETAIRHFIITSHVTSIGKEAFSQSCNFSN